MDCFGMDLIQGGDMIHFDVCKNICLDDNCNTGFTDPVRDNSAHSLTSLTTKALILMLVFYSVE